ncbi:MAG: 3,4-dihydroxy-2-butanone-4-phosphate synthase, partial [Bdellovibrionales bacterium]|nr:3,4-dihydroxy-2-butanone-4-phosphate synthase [Bdellovibrionales bacterium]NQZ17922.1 3,4-dihydroxy-2-butanone-4-phosphate synthase [Bdellovibrionales bacterium]
GVSTGISAADRAHTIRVAANPSAEPTDIIVPGHIFPIRAQNGGVLSRAGHTEGSVDLAKLGGLNPAAAICEIMNEDGSMARLPELQEFAKKFDLKIGTIEDLIRYRLETETLIKEVANEALPNPFSKEFRIKIFKNLLDVSENVVIQKGEIKADQPTLVRMQVENVLGDVFRCGKDSASWIHSTLDIMSRADSAVLVYLRKEGLHSVISQQVNGMNDEKKPRKMDPREYGIGAQILNNLGVRKINLIAKRKPNNVALAGFDLEIVDITSPVSSSDSNESSDNEIFFN